MARAFFSEVVAEAGRRRLLSDDHFSVDGTLLEAWASLKSYRPRDEQEPPSGPGTGGRNTEVDWTAAPRHVSRTDAERGYRKGHQQEAKLRWATSSREPTGWWWVELSEANGYGEREYRCWSGACAVAPRWGHRGYDTRDLSRRCAALG